MSENELHESSSNVIMSTFIYFYFLYAMLTFLKAKI